MYLTYTQEWFVDAVNFNSKQTAAFDRLSPHLRKLVSRIDSQAYTAQLEELLREKGVDIASLQSGYDFNKVDMGTGGSTVWKDGKKQGGNGGREEL